MGGGLLWLCAVTAINDAERLCGLRGGGRFVALTTGSIAHRGRDDNSVRGACASCDLEPAWTLPPAATGWPSDPVPCRRHLAPRPLSVDDTVTYLRLILHTHPDRVTVRTSPPVAGPWPRGCSGLFFFFLCLIAIGMRVRRSRTRVVTGSTHAQIRPRPTALNLLKRCRRHWCTDDSNNGLSEK